MINYARHRRKIEKMYNDRATVTRMEKVKVGGETKLQPVVKYTDQPCFLSQKALGANNQTEPVNKIAYETKLFISPDIEILQGDIIEVTRGSLKRVYTAGEPFPYPTHQEISIQRKDKA
ncbi:ABC transporter ATP-binding protein [Paenibacillus puldeungensis]|uniref:ABC transporter ATP-binding protein n=1 Tax=Paenibacillus puldeungensis TaxID=696536 RepID=A0ABW3S335_9BACL